MRRIGRRQRIKGLCALGIAAFMLCSCEQTVQESGTVIIENEDDGDAIAYEFASAEIGDVIQREKLKCVYSQSKEQRASFQINGKLVDRVLVKEGDFVKKGDLLASLSSKDLERSIEDLQYQITKGEKSLSYLDINETNDIQEAWSQYLAYTGQTAADQKSTKKRVEEIQKNYQYQREDLTDALDTNKEKMKQLKAELKNSKIYAEMDGMVYKVKENLLYSTSKLGVEIITILDVSDCFFETEVDNASELFREGEALTMTIAYGSGAGTYQLIPYHMNEWEDKQLFEILDGPDGYSLEVGTLGTMVVITDRREQVLCIPKRAIHKADGKYYVYVLGTDNMREVRWVEAGLQGDDNVEILGGLTEGEKVILQ